MFYHRRLAVVACNLPKLLLRTKLNVTLSWRHLKSAKNPSNLCLSPKMRCTITCHYYLSRRNVHFIVVLQRSQMGAWELTRILICIVNNNRFKLSFSKLQILMSIIQLQVFIWDLWIVSCKYCFFVPTHEATLGQ